VSCLLRPPALIPPPPLPPSLQTAVLSTRLPKLSGSFLLYLKPSFEVSPRGPEKTRTFFDWIFLSPDTLFPSPHCPPLTNSFLRGRTTLAPLSIQRESFSFSGLHYPSRPSFSFYSHSFFRMSRCPLCKVFMPFQSNPGCPPPPSAPNFEQWPLQFDCEPTSAFPALFYIYQSPFVCLIRDKSSPRTLSFRYSFTPFPNSPPFDLCGLVLFFKCVLFSGRVHYGTFFPPSFQILVSSMDYTS